MAGCGSHHHGLSPACWSNLTPGRLICHDAQVQADGIADDRAYVRFGNVALRMALPSDCSVVGTRFRELAWTWA